MSAVADQDLLSPELTEDPFAYYAELRASDPVHWAPASKAWLLTRYDDVVAAFGDPRLSSWTSCSTTSSRPAVTTSWLAWPTRCRPRSSPG